MLRREHGEPRSTAKSTALGAILRGACDADASRAPRDEALILHRQDQHILFVAHDMPRRVLRHELADRPGDELLELHFVSPLHDFPRDAPPKTPDHAPDA